MVTREWAIQFAQEWIAAWNAHDLERVLSLYTMNFEMSSPSIISLTNEASGVLKGQEQVAAYWRAALERMPDLHFDLQTVLLGVDSICLYYTSASGRLSAEVLFLNEEGKIDKGIAHHFQP